MDQTTSNSYQQLLNNGAD